MEEINFGFKKSIIDGTEHIFGAALQTELPKEYDYKKYMSKVLNQGSYPICVPCSISAYLNWRENLKDGKREDHEIKYFDIYGIKTNAGEGMSFKEAFKYIRHEGVDSNDGKLKISAYAMVTNPNNLKEAIVMNGPCVGALPVYNYDSDFWIKKPRNYIIGYHAISIVGYNENGFIIRNSWGEEFGNRGYTLLKYEDYDKLIEVWTVVE